MKKSLIAVGVVGLMGLTSVAVAAEFDWSGSIRAGYKSVDEGGATDKAVKTVGANTGSRIGIDASTDLGNGQSAGAELSYSIDGANLTVRRQNVFLGGGWGKLTLGKQGGIYRSAANWDQSYFHGGNIRFGGDVADATGITYASNIPGPFSFDVEVVSGGDKAVSQWASTAHYDFGGTTLNLGYHANTVKADGAISRWGVTGSYNNMAISVNGSAGGFGYYVAYEINKANPMTATQTVNPYDGKTVGVFLSYGFDSNTVYLEYESADIENNTDDPRATLLGYSRGLGEGITFIAEYLTVDQADSLSKPKTLNLSVKYDF